MQSLVPSRKILFLPRLFFFFLPLSFSYLFASDGRFQFKRKPLGSRAARLFDLPECDKVLRVSEIVVKRITCTSFDVVAGDSWRPQPFPDRDTIMKSEVKNRGRAFNSTKKKKFSILRFSSFLSFSSRNIELFRRVIPSKLWNTPIGVRFFLSSFSFFSLSSSRAKFWHKLFTNNSLRYRLVCNVQWRRRKEKFGVPVEFKEAEQRGRAVWNGGMCRRRRYRTAPQFVRSFLPKGGGQRKTRGWKKWMDMKCGSLSTSLCTQIFSHRELYIYKFSPRIKKESLVRTDRSKFQFNIIPWERIRLIVLRGGKERGDATPLSLFSFERSWNFVVNPSRDPAMTELSTRMDE